MNSSALAIRAGDGKPLARLELARRLLAEVCRVDEVKAIHDLAEAARVYARQARLGLEAQNDSAEIKLRAERRLGELLTTLPKQDGGDAARARSRRATEVPPRLDDLGISRSQSSRYQDIAAVPEPAFEQYVTEIREQGRADGKTELTTAGALLVARKYRPLRTPTPLLVSPAELTDQRHRFDVADAAMLPWPDSSSSVECSGTGTSCGSRGALRAWPGRTRSCVPQPDAVTLAYLAGAMDADGHFSVHKSSKKGDRVLWNDTYSPRVGLGQVTKAVPELLRKTFGGTIRVEQGRGRNRPLLRWLATNKLAVRACACLLPYPRIKAEQAGLLVELGIYTGKDVRKTAYWYAQQHPNWTNERLLATDEASALLGYQNPESLYQAIRNGTLLAIPSRGNVRRPRIPAGLVREILTQKTGPTMAINRVRPPQLQQERERIFRRVRELNRVGVHEARDEDHGEDLIVDTRSRASVTCCGVARPT